MELVTVLGLLGNRRKGNLALCRCLAVLISCMAFTAQAQDCVVLLHGLARTTNSMQTMAKTLTKNGYFVVNQSYPSRQNEIAQLADAAIPPAVAACAGREKIHFVSHSLGGILLRYYLRDHAISNLGRSVMLGPPNKGSQVVNAMKSVPGFVAFNGPAVLQLGADQNSVPNKLGPVNFELGVIAGSQSINLILSNFLPNPDDGKVSVANTKVEGMADHLILPVAHPFLMSNSVVIKQTLYFLKHGRFEREPAQS